MKIRIQDNSIRLRISQSELNQLHLEGKIVGRLEFQNATAFEYVLEGSIKSEILTACFEKSQMIISIPIAFVEELKNTNRVGFQQDNNAEQGGLKILVEKDFKCLTSRDENEEDLFDNPKANC